MPLHSKSVGDLSNISHMSYSAGSYLSFLCMRATVEETNGAAMATRQISRLLQRAAPVASRVLADSGVAKPYAPFLCRSVRPCDLLSASEL